MRPREHPPDDQGALRLGRDRTRGGVGARQLLEQVREGADRTAEERRRALQQVALDPVDVRAVRHDQNRVLVERGEIAVEKGRHLARVGRAGEKRQRHAAILVPGPDGSWTWNGAKLMENAEKKSARGRRRITPRQTSDDGRVELPDGRACRSRTCRTDQPASRRDAHPYTSGATSHPSLLRLPCCSCHR